MNAKTLRRLDARIVRLFAAECAARVLPLYDQRRDAKDLDGERLRQAVDAARRYANGEIDAGDMGWYRDRAQVVARYIPKVDPPLHFDRTDYTHETLCAVARAAILAAGNEQDIIGAAAAAVRAVYCNAQIGARPDIPSRATPAGMPGDYEVRREREWQAQRLSELRREFNRRRYERRQLAYSQIAR